jgi:ribosomal-protein-serine acetyltransferase
MVIVKIMNTGSLIIRPWRDIDADDLYRLVRQSVSELNAWLPWCRSDYSRNDTDDWIRHSLKAWSHRSEFPMAIVNRDSGEVLGGVGINKIDWDTMTGNLGYWVGTPWTRRGIAREAARQAAKFAFSELRLKTLEILCHPDNIASRKVAESLGALNDGIHAKRIELHGMTVDAVVYRLATDLASR